MTRQPRQPNGCRRPSERQQAAAPSCLILTLASVIVGCRPDFDFRQAEADLPRYVNTVQNCRITALFHDRPRYVTRFEVNDNQALPGSRHAWEAKCGDSPVIIDFPDPGEVGRPAYYDLHTGMQIRVRITPLRGLASGGVEVMPPWTRGRLRVVRYEGEN